MAHKNKQDKKEYMKKYRQINGKSIDDKRRNVIKDKFDNLSKDEQDEFIKKRRETALKSYYKHKEKILKRNRETAFKRNLKYLYGITHEEYLDILKSQDNKCAICKCAEFENRWTSTNLPFAVDHCHETNKIRGLLCDNCNVMIGHAKDNIDTLKSAISYLNK